MFYTNYGFTQKIYLNRSGGQKSQMGLTGLKSGCRGKYVS